MNNEIFVNDEDKDKKATRLPKRKTRKTNHLFCLNSREYYTQGCGSTRQRGPDGQMSLNPESGKERPKGDVRLFSDQRAP